MEKLHKLTITVDLANRMKVSSIVLSTALSAPGTSDHHPGTNCAHQMQRTERPSSHYIYETSQSCLFSRNRGA